MRDLPRRERLVALPKAQIEAKIAMLAGGGQRCVVPVPTGVNRQFRKTDEETADIRAQGQETLAMRWDTIAYCASVNALQGRRRAGYGSSVAGNFRPTGGRVSGTGSGEA